jgi:type IV secretory pathway VirB2 component (pilin)
MSSHTAERAPRRAVSGWFTFALLALGPGALAWAAGSGMPWEGPLEQVVDSITGPVARAAAVIAIVVAGVTIIFSEGGGGIRKLAFVGLGIAIMFAAVSFFLDFFGFAGGAVI